MPENPIVFADFHHQSLLYSLILLVEGRLGGSVFFPIGRDWQTQGYWKLSEHPAVIGQFLGCGNAASTEVWQGITVHWCPLDHYRYKAVALDDFFRLPVEVVIASIPEHLEPFRRLCQLHPNRPQLVFQIGNSWSVEAGTVEHVLASALLPELPDSVHHITYHQEFPLSLFYPSFAFPGQGVSSFMNGFSKAGIYQADWQLFQQVERLMPDWTFRSFGGECRDGKLYESLAIADRMREARFIWHTKFGGDGYGHVIYNSAAVARPLIVRLADYRGKLGEELMIDGVTCLSIDGLHPEAVKEKILHYSDEQRYTALCRQVYRNFKEKVDFDREAEALKVFFRELRG